MRVATWTTNHWKSISAAICCFVIGLLVPGLLAQEEVVEVAEESPFVPPRLVATDIRRAEPIAPLVAFEALDEKLVRIGKELFQDAGLSNPPGKMSCASCHNVRHGGIEPNALKQAAPPSGHYNTPTVINAGLKTVLHWEGSFENLEDQLDVPITHPQQMNSSWEKVTKYVRSRPRYRISFQENFGAAPSERLIREALASYLRYLVGTGSKFDQWLAGEEMALTTDELSGYLSFRKLNCVACHQGATVGATMVQHLGPLKEHFASSRELGESDLGRFNFTKDEKDKFVFRVPSLRTASSTAPYFHDGSAKTLEEAVEIMIRTHAGTEPNSEVVRRIALFIKSLEAEPPDLEFQAKIELEVVE